jgi:hypothetical protein
MYNASSKEIIKTLNEVFKLKADWYELPKGEKVEEQPASDETPKNA